MWIQVYICNVRHTYTQGNMHVRFAHKDTHIHTQVQVTAYMLLVILIASNKKT